MTTVEVQVSRTVKVAGTVLEADRQRDVAIIRIDPAVMASFKPLPLKCPGTAAPPVAREQEIIAIAAPLRQNRGINWGAVTRFDARVITTELNLAAGSLGGPVFNTAGDLIGITTLHGEREEPIRGIVKVARIDPACDVVAAAAKKMQDTPAPSAAQLPMEPAKPAPVAEFKDAVRKRAGNLKPYQMITADFDVGFITPILAYAAQSQMAQDFGAWSDYVADVPPVLFVRVTPKMVESVWAKMARGAAYTQGMALPAIKRQGAGFNRLRAFCGSTEVTPIHPFKVELRVSETDAIYEGLYAFDPAALGPGCGTVSLELYSEKAPEKADTRVVDPKLLQQIWRDFGPAVSP
jgi:trypsin-like peptidase